MSGPLSRLSKLASHFAPSSASPTTPDVDTSVRGLNFHTLSPTFFLPRAAQIEPDAQAVYHSSSTAQTLRYTYAELSSRASDFAYYLRKHNLLRIGILAPNTPAFLTALFGISGAGGINVGINYRLKKDDIAYIFEHAAVDMIIADAEFVGLLDQFRTNHPRVKILVDEDRDGQVGAFEDAVREGREWDQQNGGRGWSGLEAQATDEEGLISLAYTSGTTARPKGVEYTHRGAYLAAMGNVIESGLNYHTGRSKYLWTLPMFHANGWTFPWAVTAVRGTHYCLRKIDYPQIWKLLKEEGVTHFNAAPTVNTLLCAAKEAEKLEHPVRVTVAASPPTAFLFETMTNLNLHPVHVYGMTETYGPITKGYHMPAWEDLSISDKYARMARQGHGFVTSLPVRVIRTDKPEDVLEDVERNGQEIGEIVFEGNICAKGYHRDPEATRKLFAGGVLHSGDLAVCHPDGAIQILDRAKDIIISGGENISSVALESMLVRHPDVLEAGVVAVHDSHWGERPKAFVTVKESSKSGNEPLQGESVIDWAKHQSDISRFMVPREVEIVNELPKTSTGKIKKNVLRDWAKGADRRQTT